MFAYIARRVLATIPVMAVVALFVFSLLYIAPGDPAAVIAGDQGIARRRRSASGRTSASIGHSSSALASWLWQNSATRPRHIDLHELAGHHHDRAYASSRRCH